MKSRLKKILAVILSVLMVPGLAPAPAMTAVAVAARPGNVTITVMDENGNALPGASVDYVIDSAANGDGYRQGSKTTDESGTVDVLPAEEYGADDLTIRAAVSKKGYGSDTSAIADKRIVSADQDMEVVLKSRTIQDIVVTAAALTYDGESHEAAVISGVKNTDMVSYRLDGGEWTDVMPKIEDAGTYTLAVKVEREGYDAYVETVSPEIKRAEITIEEEVLRKDFDGKASRAIEIIDGEEAGDDVTYQLNGGKETSKVPEIRNAGEYSVTVNIHRDENYADFSRTYKAMIRAAEIEGLSATFYNGTYDGNDHPAVVLEGKEAGDTVEYKQDDGSWASGIPEKRNAGTYTVTIRVQRADHDDKEFTGQVVITKAQQKLQFKEAHTEDTVTFDTEDSSKNEYDFSAESDLPGAALTYTVENDSADDSTDIADIASIDTGGKLTVKKGGYNIKITATAAGDANHEDTSVSYRLAVKNEEENLISFSDSTVSYVLNGDTTQISDSQATVRYSDDQGTVKYSYSCGNGQDIGVTIDTATGLLSVSDYGKLAAALTQNGDTLTLTVTAEKGEGKKTDSSGEDKAVYGAGEAGYTINVSFAPLPADPFRLQDSAPGAEEEYWHNTEVVVLPAAGYTIAKNEPVSFGSRTVFDDQGDSKTKREIYLKNADGGITCPVSLKLNIDTIAPDSNMISIQYSREVLSKVFWFYNPDVTVTVTGYDSTSGIHHFNWSYTRSEGASTVNVEEAGGEAAAVQDTDDKNKYTATFTLPLHEAEQLKGRIVVSATDNAGLTSENKTDDGRVIVVDSISPTRNVVYELKTPGGTQQTVGDRHYYSDEVEFTFTVTEANFFGEDVSIKVSKDGGGAEEQEVSWNATSVQDGQEARIVLSDDGDYVVSMTYKDRSGNEMEAYESEHVIVDKTAPVISFAYSNGNRVSAPMDDPQTVTVTITEHNFRAGDLELVMTASDIQGKAVPAKDLQTYLRNAASWKREGDVHTAVISGDLVDAVYTMEIRYKDLALNAAETVRSGAFTVDHTAPAISDMAVSYSTPAAESLLSAVTFGFYQADVTVTFTATDRTSGVAYFTWSYQREEGASETNVEKYTNIRLNAVQDSADKSRFTASVTLPRETAEQLRGGIAFTATDRYSNTSEKLTDSGQVIVVDTIAPTMTAEYTTANRRAGSRMYYKKACTATFTVTEANFYAEDVVVEVSKNGGGFKKIKPVWRDRSTDIHVGTYRLSAPGSHKRDGDYIFRVRYTDRSTNTMKTYRSKVLVIDTIKPSIKVSYANKKPKNTIKDTDGKNRKYFDAAQTATITVTEHNFSAADMDIRITAQDVNGRALKAGKLSKKSKWKTDGDKHTMKITYSGDANYIFDVAYADLTENKADKYRRDYFTVDKTAPTGLQVDYSTSLLDRVLSGVTFGFYNAKTTVTITANDTISGVHSFNYSYLKAAGVSSVNAELVNQLVQEAGITYSSGRSRATAKFDIPKSALGRNSQFNGTVAFTASDRGENKSTELSDKKRIVVDNIAPTAAVEYSAPVREADGIAYYDGTVNATVTVNEANFYPEDVTVSVTRNGSAYAVTPSWSNTNTDIHIGTFSLADDGDYFVTVNYRDKSNNQMAEYTSGQLTVDTQIAEPVITVNGAEAAGKAFKDEVLPAVSFEDVNYEGYEIRLTRTRYDSQNEDVTEAFIGSQVHVNAQGGTGSFDTFAREADVDGIYTLTVSVTDKAGHSAESSAVFTVNRFGSVYVYNDYLNSLIRDGGIYTQGIEDDLVITEYNADRLLDGSLNIEISRDGRPLDTVDYDLTPEINDQVSVGSSGWYQYQYTIDKGNFASDGIYKIAISSKDATGNTPEINNYENKAILFRVDSTAPEINSIVGLEKDIINAQNVNIKYTVYDTIGLASITVFVNDKAVETITDFSDNANDYEGSFMIDESSSVQSVKLVIEDLAKNITDTSTTEFQDACAYDFHETITVSTSPLVRAAAWIRTNILVVLGVAAALAALAGAAFYLLYRRKKQSKETER